MLALFWLGLLLFLLSGHRKRIPRKQLIILVNTSSSQCLGSDTYGRREFTNMEVPPPMRGWSLNPYQCCFIWILNIKKKVWMLVKEYAVELIRWDTASTVSYFPLQHMTRWRFCPNRAHSSSARPQQQHLTANKSQNKNSRTRLRRSSAPTWPTRSRWRDRTPSMDEEWLWCALLQWPWQLSSHVHRKIAQEFYQ